MRSAWLGVAGGGATTLACVGLLAASPTPPPVHAGSVTALDATVAWEPAPRGRAARPPHVPTRPARAQAVRRRARQAPVELRIPAVGLRASIVAAGVTGKARRLALAPDPRRVNWYRHGARPGEPGTALLAAHVDFDGRPGAFRRLHRVEPGNRVAVRLRRGGTRRFRVVARRRYDKDALPDRLFRLHGPRVLALVTCAGGFDERTRTYDSNTVVYALAEKRSA